MVNVRSNQTKVIFLCLNYYIYYDSLAMKHDSIFFCSFSFTFQRDLFSEDICHKSQQITDINTVMLQR